MLDLDTTKGGQERQLSLVEKQSLGSNAASHPALSRGRPAPRPRYSCLLSLCPRARQPTNVTFPRPKLEHDHQLAFVRVLAHTRKAEKTPKQGRHGRKQPFGRRAF